MGLKAWLARHTSSPFQYAHAYAPGLLELAEYLAASFVAFSGKQPAKGVLTTKEVLFENHFDMEQAGFEPVTKDISSLLAPSISEMSKEDHFGAAYRDVTTFLSLCSDNQASRAMKPQNAEQFCRALYSAVALRCAGKFGFESEPRDAFMTIKKLLPVFLCERMLNRDAFGKEDGLGNLLIRLSVSPDGNTRYAFVVGSQQQPLGCASPFVRVLTELNDKIESCAREVRW